MSNELFLLADHYRQLADEWLAHLNEFPDSPFLEGSRELHRQTAFKAVALRAEAQELATFAAALLGDPVSADETPLVRANLDKQHSTVRPKPAEPYVWHAKIAPEPPPY